MGLEYKGYKYDLVGYIQEKRNDAELVKEIKSLNELANPNASMGVPNIILGKQLFSILFNI